VSSKDFYLALVATTVETGNPAAELKPGLDLLEPIREKSVDHSDLPFVCTYLYLPAVL